MKTLRQLLCESLPWTTPGRSEELVYVTENERLDDEEERAEYAQRATIVLRLVLWSGNRIDDVLEQSCTVAPSDDSSEERLTAFVAALRTVSRQVMHTRGSRRENPRLLPRDLLCWSPLRLKINTQEEFERALCTKGRLGKYLTGEG